ncbi:ABC transporter permease [Gemmatimonadetes bacterium T265]|nr:ABC transporter permease [Gemmatimonadetes bacterium T265]
MHKLLVVVKREFLERVRTRAFLITTLLGPVFFAALMIFPAWLALRQKGSDTVAAVTVLDATGTRVGDRVARALADSLPAGAPASSRPVVQHVAPAELPAAERAATAAVVRKERQGVLVLDSATTAGRSARYAGRNASSMADVQHLRDVVRREVLTARLEQAGFPADRVAPIAGARLHLSATSITDSGAGGGGGVGSAIVAMVVAFLLYMTILLYGQNVLRSVIEEKTTRVAEVIVASVRPDVLMAGKVFGVGAVGLLQQLIWFGGAAAVAVYVMPFLHLGERAGAAGAAAQAAQAADATTSFVMPEISFAVVASAVLFFLLGYLLYSALFAAAGAMVNSDQEAQQAAFPVMLPLIGSAVFIQTVVQNPEAGVSRFMAWFPLTAPVLMPMRMALVSTTPLEVGLVVLGLVATVLAALWLAARIYRVGLLMYGKRPSVGELARWVRQAA